MKKQRKQLGGRFTGLKGKDNRAPEVFDVGISTECSHGYSATQDEPRSHTSGEVALWRAVVMQALTDLGTKPADKYEELSKSRTEQWFDIDNVYFQRVCSLANLEPVYILRKIHTVDGRKELIKALNRRYI